MLVEKEIIMDYNKLIESICLKYANLSRLDMRALTEEDIMSILSAKDLLSQLTPQEYAQLFYQIVLSLADSREFDLQVKRLSNLPCLINSAGDYVYPRELLFASTIKDIKQYSLIHEAFIPLLENQCKRDLTLRDFLERLGVGEIVSNVIEGSKYIFYIENSTQTVHPIDEEFNYVSQLKIDVDNLPKETLCGFVDGNNSKYCKYVYETYNKIHHDRFIKIGLVAENIQYSTAIIDVSGKIIVPFGWKRGDCIIDEVNSRILYVSILDEGYNNDVVNYILTNDCIYSFDGESLFPNKDCQYDKVSIIHNSSAGLCIGADIEGNFYVIKKDYNVLPFETQIGKNEVSNLKFSYTFEFLNNELIKAIHHTGYDPVFIIMDNNGRKLLRRCGVCEYDSKLNKFISYNRQITSIYDKTGSHLCDVVDSRDIYYCKDTIRIKGEVIKVKKSYKHAGTNLEYYGLLDKQLNIVFPIICESISKLCDNGPYRIKVNGKYGLLDEKGALTIPLCHDFINGSSKWVNGIYKNILYTVKDFTIAEDERGRKMIQGGTRRIIDIYGNEIVENVDFERIQQLYSYADECFVLAKRTYNPESKVQNGLYGVFDCDFNVIIPFEYDYIKFDHNYLVCNKGGMVDEVTKEISGGKWGVKLGDTLTDCIYDSLEICPRRHYIKIELNNKQGLLDSSGNIVVPTDFDNVYLPWCNKARVNNGGIWYFYDIEKQKIDSPALHYDYVGDFVNGYAVYRNEGKYGYLNENYNIHLSHVFEYAEDFDCEGVAKVIFNDKRILMDILGNEVGEWQERHQSYVDDYACREDDTNWEEEAWYHLTGGQYGDYPGGDIDYDFLGL